jgi:outer membrane protein assembly factor BamD (BamD/ComL family)
MSETTKTTEYKCSQPDCDKVCKTKQGLISHERSHGIVQPTKEVLQRVENVEFNIESDEQAKEICAHLAQLESTIGWIYLKKMLQSNMAIIERQIITKISIEDGQILDDEEIDRLRHSYLAYEELITKPRQMIEQIGKGNVPSIPKYDPYSSELKDRENYAGVMEDG